MNVPTQFMTELEAAEYLLVKRSTLAAWRRRSVGPPYFRLPSVGTGERSEIRYRRLDIDSFVSVAIRDPLPDSLSGSPISAKDFR